MTQEREQRFTAWKGTCPAGYILPGQFTGEKRAAPPPLQPANAAPFLAIRSAIGQSRRACWPQGAKWADAATQSGAVGTAGTAGIQAQTQAVIPGGAHKTFEVSAVKMLAMKCKMAGTV